MRIEHILIGIAIFIAVLTLGTQMYLDQEDNYDIGLNGSLFDKMNLTGLDDDYETHKSDLRDNSLGGGSAVSDEDTESSIYKDAVDEVRKMGTSVSNANKIVTTVSGSEVLNIPEFITDLLLRVIIVLAIVFVIYMVARFKPQD